MAKINWTDQANNDIDAIIDFLAHQSELRWS
jgi:plasmid stabilization system protein ParE